MISKVALSILLPAVLTNSGCSSAPIGRVVETDKGNLEAIGSAKGEPDARITALDQATSYCSLKNKRPIFKEDELKENIHSRKFNLNLKNLPVIGKAFKGDDKTQVIIAFRCTGKSS
ncbi:MAG: hypothetical protein ABIQ95_03695 [Bdellovibrionia bacterium]